MRALLLLLSLALSPANAADPVYAPEQRLALIEHSLDALKQSKAQALENLESFFALLSRGACRSDDAALRIACFQQEARKNCTTARGGASAKTRCTLISDLLAVNQLNEKQFVSIEDRAALFQKSGVGSFGVAYARLLSRKYATLATELLLAPGKGCNLNEPRCLSAAVNDYCLQNADLKGIPWQACVSGIVWFIGRES